MSEEINNHHHHNKNKYHKKRHGIFFPLLLVTVGVYMLYNNFGNPQGGTIGSLLQLWPLLLIVGGLDGIITGDGFVSSIIIMGVGAFFLANNLGYLQSNDLWSLLRFWPVILIAVGLDLIVGRHSIWSAIIGILLGLALLFGVAWMAINPIHQSVNTPLESQSFSQKLKDISKAHIDISKVTGFVSVSGKTEPSELIHSNVSLNQGELLDEKYSQEGKTGYYRLKDREDDFPYFLNYRPSSKWDIQLSSMIPLDMDFQVIIGEMNLDLRKIEIDNLESELIIGKTVITLPEGNYDGDITTPVGEIILYVPEDSDVRIRAETAVTVVNYPAEYEKRDEIISSDPSLYNSGSSDITLTVSIPVGNLQIITY